MSALGAIAWNGFREARRNRVTVVVAAFAIVTLLASTLVHEVTVSTFYRVLTDFGLGSMSLIMVFLAVFLSCGLLPKEIERRTIFLVVSKPVSRGTFLVGRVLGNALTLALLLMAMTLIFWSQLWLFKEEITASQSYAIVGLWFELLLITCAGAFFSTFAGQVTAAVATTGLYLAGHLTEDVAYVASFNKSEFLQQAGKAIFYLLPNLESVNFRLQAAYDAPVAMSSLIKGGGMMLGWSAMFIGLGIVIFNRRDFR